MAPLAFSMQASPGSVWCKQETKNLHGYWETTATALKIQYCSLDWGMTQINANLLWIKSKAWLKELLGKEAVCRCKRQIVKDKKGLKRKRMHSTVCAFIDMLICYAFHSALNARVFTIKSIANDSLHWLWKSFTIGTAALEVYRTFVWIWDQPQRFIRRYSCGTHFSIWHIISRVKSWMTF